MNYKIWVEISEIFNGEKEGLYSYKKGNELVLFFNSNFGYKDVYKSGFPTRKNYVADKLEELYQEKKIDLFFNIILSKRFIISDLKNITETEALVKQNLIIEIFNKILLVEGFQIYKLKNDFFLKEIDKNLEKIGDGGFAEVFINKSTNLVHKKLKDEIAADSGMVSRFKREYEITQSLQDVDNIVKVYDYNSISNEYTMEYCNNNLLNLVNGSNLTEDKKIEIVLVLLETMAIVHRKNIIHRDLCPTNILFKNEKMKIADFGLGKNLDILHSHKTIHTNMFGQYHYCDPEQYMNLKEGDMQSDIYSLGRIINFIFTKNHNDTSHIFKYVCEKATSSDRTYRYTSAKEMLQSINDTIARKTHEDREKNIQHKLFNLIFDEEVEEWIYEMDGVKLCNHIIPMKAFYVAVLKFSEKSKQNAQHIIDLVKTNYKIACKSYESYDSIAYLSEYLLGLNIDFEYKEKCCLILHDIAYNVNRFSIQRLIDKIITSGVDILLEDILKK